MGYIKALKLLYKSNPTIFEWCASPITYVESDLLKEFKTILPKFFSYKRCLSHYYHMAETNYRGYLNTPEVKIKKYFYVLRPLLAAQWIIHKHCSPPIAFSELVDAELDFSIKSEVEKLLKLKKELPEMGLAPKVQILNDYIDEKLIHIRTIIEDSQDNRLSWDPLNQFFLKAIENIE